jgi:hypothetical protein
VLHFSSRSFKDGQPTKNIGATSFMLLCRVSGTVDANWPLLKIDEYLVNPE